MAFDGLSEKLSAAFKRLRSKGKLSESDVKEAMREVLSLIHIFLYAGGGSGKGNRSGGFGIDEKVQKPVLTGGFGHQ